MYALNESDRSRIARMLRDYESGRLLPRGERQQIALPRDKAVVQISNATAGTLEKGSVVSFTDYELGDDELAEDNFWFTGDEIDTAKPGWGVVLHPIPTGGVGMAQISGVCSALVDLANTSHKFADIESSSTVAKSGASGPLSILRHNGTAEEQLCPVFIDRGGNTGRWLLKADADVPTFTAGTFSIWSGTAGAETDTGENATFYNRTGTQIDAGAWAEGVEINGQKYAVPWTCES